MNPAQSYGPESVEHIGEAVTIIIDLIDQVLDKSIPQAAPD